jgi:uncharacterized protein (TIGR03083 family)
MSLPTGPAAPPQGLRERVLERSLGLRPAGRATPAPDPVSAPEAFRRAANSLEAMLDTLAEAQWHRPVLRGLDVQGLIGHLIGVEEHLQLALSGDPSVADADHVAFTQPSSAAQSGLPVAATRGAWGAAVARTLDLLRIADPDAELALHGLRLPVSAICVVRTFELWTHENDVRRALDLPASWPDASALTLMTRLAAHLLPLVAAGAEQLRPVDLRLVLTGPGGGTWQLALGDAGPPATAVGIVADAVAFCRLVANRTTPADLKAHVTGDPATATAILRAAAALALD